MDSALAEQVGVGKLSEKAIKPRKAGLNRNKEGSVRKVNGKVYVDFMYFGERVRESSGLLWNEKNVRHVRGQLDKIIVSIKSETFRFADIFPESKKVQYFTDKELNLFGGNKKPDQVVFRDYAWTWYNILKNSGRVSERTLWGYKSYLKLYLIPFFGNMTFGNLNKSTFDKFAAWSVNQEYREKKISNNTINKIFVPLKIICKNAAIEYGWGSSYNPFFGFKKLPEHDCYEKIIPFSLEEQRKVIEVLPEHWKPFFMFAFCSGLREGEQIAVKLEDIDWNSGTLAIRRAVTRDEEGRFMIGQTKNRYSRRTIRLNMVMQKTLEEQKKIYDHFNGEYFFCSTTGNKVCQSNVRLRVWKPALKRAGIIYREIKQTRHSFATNSLISGENPLWIARVMGHRNTDMIIKVYSKYIEDAGNQKDGSNLDKFYQVTDGNKE